MSKRHQKKPGRHWRAQIDEYRQVDNIQLIGKVLPVARGATEG